MKKFSLSLLIFSSEKMAKDIAENLKSVRPDWQWKISIAADPQSAIEKFKTQKPALVFLSDKLPETTPAAFSRELMKISTESSLFCFHEAEIEESHEFGTVSWPVLSWERCADQILSGLSKEVQERLGGQKSLSPLRLSLEEYAKKYQLGDMKYGPLKKRVWIPVYSGTASLNSAENIVPQGDVNNSKPVSFEIQVPSKMEWHVLVGSILIGSVFWLYRPEDEMILLSGMRLLSGAIVVVSFLGFFISRAFFKIKK